MVTHDISNESELLSAMDDWNDSGDSADTYQLTANVVTTVTALNNDGGSNYTFDGFSATFDGQGYALTINGEGLQLSTSPFSDLSGGTIKDLSFNLNDCDQNVSTMGFLVGKSISTTKDYGNLTNLTISAISCTLRDGGSYVVGAWFGYQTINSIMVQNCSVEVLADAVVSVPNGGCMFGQDCFFEVAEDVTIKNCSITTESSLQGLNVGGLMGSGSFNHAMAPILIKGCSFTGNIASVNGGGLFGGNDSASTPKGCFYNNHTDNDITIENCSFTGDITDVGENAGGLFGRECFAYDEASSSGGLVSIKGCTINGDVKAKGSGGIGGFRSFEKSSVAVTTDNCSFSGSIDGENAGGFFGARVFQNTDSDVLSFNIVNSDISANITGESAGGMIGELFSLPTDNILKPVLCTIDNNTCSVNLQGSNSGAIFGSQLLHDIQYLDLTISNNVITIVNANSAVITAVVSVMGVSGETFINKFYNTVAITNNTIKSIGSLSHTNFGGIFGFNGDGVLNNAGQGTLSITNNNLSELQFTILPSTDNEYLFNESGIQYYDTTSEPKIFASVTIQDNTFPEPEPIQSTTKTFTTYDYMLQWIYKNSLASLEEQTTFESYALYLPRQKAQR